MPEATKRAGFTFTPTQNPETEDETKETDHAGKAKSFEELVHEEIEDLRAEINEKDRVIADMGRQIRALRASQARTLGRIPARKHEEEQKNESVYDEEELENNTDVSTPASAEADLRTQASAIARHIISQYPELAETEEGRMAARKAYESLVTEGLVVPGETPVLTVLEYVGKLGVKILEAQKAQVERREQIKKAVRKVPMGAKAIARVAPSKTPQEEDEEYEKNRGPHSIPRA